MKLRIRHALFAVLLLLAGCAAAPNAERIAPEAEVTLLPLAGPVAAPESELSGLAWLGDTLILLPQYPSLVGGAVYGLPKTEILDALDALASGGEIAPLQPRPIALHMPAADRIPGYEGLEAIAIDGRRAWVSIETSHEGATGSVLLRGEFSADLGELRLDAEPRTVVTGRSRIDNYAEESLLWHAGELISLHEANGGRVNPTAQAQRFDATLRPLEPLPFPRIEYRITDASSADAEGHFWVINSLYRRSLRKLDPAPDAITARHGTPPSQVAGDTVERLLQLHHGSGAIRLTDRPPINLRLAGDGKSRNWEGLARLPERDGFLLVTDKYPGTLLGFIPLPESN